MPEHKISPREQARGLLLRHAERNVANRAAALEQSKAQLDTIAGAAGPLPQLDIVLAADAFNLAMKRIAPLVHAVEVGGGEDDSLLDRLATTAGEQRAFLREIEEAHLCGSYAGVHMGEVMVSYEAQLGAIEAVARLIEGLVDPEEIRERIVDLVVLGGPHYGRLGTRYPEPEQHEGGDDA